jgi:MoaA/NifB/PqqE/SkfB family radical SAM enzyme
VFSDQRAPGKISLSQISQILNDGTRVPNLQWVYLGGGEPFTQYPLLLKGVQRSKKLDYKVGVETNGYFARSIEAGIRFLRPLAEMGINDIRISNDSWHYKNPEISPASKAVKAAQKLGIPTTVVHIPSADNHDRHFEQITTYNVPVMILNILRVFISMLTDSCKYARELLSGISNRNHSIELSKTTSQQSIRLSGYFRNKGRVD